MPPATARARLGREVGLVLQSRFAEVDLIVDHAGQQPLAGRIDDRLVGTRLEAVGDRFDATVAQAHVGDAAGPFIDQLGIADQPVLHCPFPSDLSDVWRRKVNCIGT